MAYSRLAFVALAVVCVMPVQAAQVKWVPLKQVKPGTANEPVAPRTQTPPATIAPTPAPLPEPPVAAAEPAPQLVAPAAPAAVGTSQPLQVSCLGGGTANKVAAATAFGWGSFHGSAGGTWFSGATSGTTTLFGTRQQGFSDQVDIRLFTGDDRIRLPRTMLPPIHGGAAGWFKLKDVVVDARFIRASAAINFMNNPKIYIDRVTGTISISGKAGDFTGQCQAVAADAAPKF